jgi:type I restriction enzyme R subunit
VTSNLLPEQRARANIDAALLDAGWVIQNRDETILSAGRGVAVRESRMAEGHGFVDGRPVGALEAKPEGVTLASVEVQADKYSTGLPDTLDAPVRPLPYVDSPERGPSGSGGAVCRGEAS